MSEIPEPEETGSTGEQEPAAGELIAPGDPPPWMQGTVVDELRGLAAEKPRSFGSDAMARMMTASMMEKAVALAEAIKDLKSCQKVLETTRAELGGSTRREAVLNERILSSNDNRHRRNLSIAVGIALIGIGLQTFEQHKLLSGAVAVIGAVLVSLGWYQRTPEPPK